MQAQRREKKPDATVKKNEKMSGSPAPQQRTHHDQIPHAHQSDQQKVEIKGKPPPPLN